MKNLNLVILAVNISRVYEIALLGGHSVKLVAGINPDTDKPFDERDIQMLRDFYQFGNGETFNADMVVEVAFSPEDIFRTIQDDKRTETIYDILDRVKEIKENTEGWEITDIPDKASWSLLKTAINRLSFSLYETACVINLAKTIARLDQSKVVKAEHIAEAVQYKSYRPAIA